MSNTTDELISEIWRENIGQVAELIGAGADTNAAGSKGWTPLMQAAEMENIAIARLLIENGADVNRAGHQGYTPLHIAVDISIDGTIQSGRMAGEEPTEMIEFLLGCGASLDAKDEHGEAAIDFARSYSSKKIIDFLEAWHDRPPR